MNRITQKVDAMIKRAAKRYGAPRVFLLPASGERVAVNALPSELPPELDAAGLAPVGKRRRAFLFSVDEWRRVRSCLATQELREGLVFLEVDEDGVRKYKTDAPATQAVAVSPAARRVSATLIEETP